MWLNKFGTLSISTRLTFRCIHPRERTLRWSVDEADKEHSLIMETGRERIHWKLNYMISGRASGSVVGRASGSLPARFDPLDRSRGVSRQAGAKAL
jgi:hypothetical protein